MVKNQKSTCSWKCRSVLVNSLNKGKPSPFKGKTDRWSSEQRKKIGDSQRGKQKSEEFKIKCSNRMKGKEGFFKGHKHTEEWKKNQSLNRSGEKHYNFKGRNSTGVNRSNYSVMLRREKIGFTKEIFDKQLETQNNMCAICGDEFNEKIPMKKKAADHCHISNKPRGILCRNCNFLIGHAKDKVEILASAINYLNFWNRTA